MTSWGQWIAAFASTYTVVANLLPFFLVMVLLITGVLIPYCIILPISLTKAQLTVVWRYTMYYISPATYLISGVLGAVLNGVPVVCSPLETAMFNPPSGQTCGAYASDFVGSSLGYLVNPNSTADCQYCSLRNANEVCPQLYFLK